MNKGHKVSPLSTKTIRKTAQGIKGVLVKHLKNKSKFKKTFFPIVWLVEAMHQKGLIELEIRETSEMPNDYGLSYPQKNIIIIRNDVYDRALEGDGFGRLTVAHELGHLVLHRNESVFARNKHGGMHKTYEDSEWQANKFAQEFLVDTRYIESHFTKELISSSFGVTPSAASITYKALIKDGYIKNASSL